MRYYMGALVATVWLAGGAVAEPVSAPPALPRIAAPDVETAMARLEARVLQIARPGGVVERFFTPYSPVPAPDPFDLSDFNRAHAADWTDRFDMGVEQVVVSQAGLTAWMERRPDVLASQLVVPRQDAVLATVAPGRLSEAALLEAPAPARLFSSQTETAVIPGTSGFFGDE